MNAFSNIDQTLFSNAWNYSSTNEVHAGVLSNQNVIHSKAKNGDEFLDALAERVSFQNLKSIGIGIGMGLAGDACFLTGNLLAKRLGVGKVLLPVLADELGSAALISHFRPDRNIGLEMAEGIASRYLVRGGMMMAAELAPACPTVISLIIVIAATSAVMEIADGYITGNSSLSDLKPHFNGNFADVAKEAFFTGILKLIDTGIIVGAGQARNKATKSAIEWHQNRGPRPESTVVYKDLNTDQELPAHDADARISELFGDGLSMKDIARSFKAGALHAEIEISEHADTLLVAGKLMNKQGQEVGHHSRHYYLKQEQGKTVLHADGNHTRTDIDEGFNNQGIGKQLVLSTFRFNFNSPNVTHYSFYATEVGKYSWRNCTLPFTSDSLTQIQQSLRKYGVPEKAIAKIRTPRDASRLTTILPSPARFLDMFAELPGAPFLRTLALARKPGIAALLSVPDAWGVEWDDAYRKSHPNEKFFEE